MSPNSISSKFQILKPIVSPQFNTPNEVMTWYNTEATKEEKAAIFKYGSIVIHEVKVSFSTML